MTIRKWPWPRRVYGDWGWARRRHGPTGGRDAYLRTGRGGRRTALH